MDVEQILEELDSSRERLLLALEPLPDEALVEPGAMGDWSVADILAHLTAWESEIVTGLMMIYQGRTPTRLLRAFEDVDGYNARQHADNEGRNLDVIFDDLQGVRVQLEQWLEEFSDRELNDPQRYSWSKGLPLWHLVKENSFGHEEEHLPDIEVYAEQWLAKHEQQEVDREPDEES